MLTKLPRRRSSDIRASNPPLRGPHVTPDLSDWPSQIVWDRNVLSGHDAHYDKCKGYVGLHGHICSLVKESSNNQHILFDLVPGNLTRPLQCSLNIPHDVGKRLAAV